MPSCQLVLPLPPSYAYNSQDGYSFFDVEAPGPELGNAIGGTGHASLQRYLDDLCAFLDKTRLIQCHPESFFDNLVSETTSTTRAHLDGSPITEEERTYTLGLCDAFATLFASGTMKELDELIRDGPSHESAQLRSFYEEVCQLKMGRTRRKENDAASLTLLDKDRRRLLRAEQKMAKAGKSTQQTRLLQHILGYGMSPKKQHETSIMRATVADIVKCCNLPDGSNANKREGVQTVINIGEGKGYVSRALAFCDGLQVIGLDCNPSHKEKVAEDLEYLLGGSLKEPSSGYGRDVVNLMYTSRGHVASITCCIGEQTDLASLLQGYVRLMPDTAPVGAVDDVPTVSQNKKTSCLDLPGQNARTVATVETEMEAEGYPLYVRKMRCRVCGAIVVQSPASALLKHIKKHADEEVQASSIWCPADGATLPAITPGKGLQEGSYSERVKEIANTYFTADTGTSEDNEGSLMLHLRCGDETDKSFPPYQRWLRLSREITRGYRVVLYAPTVCHQVEAEADMADPPATPASSRSQYIYTQRIATIVGYDHASSSHHIVYDDDTQRRSVILYEPRQEPLFVCHHPSDHQGISPPILKLLPFAQMWSVQRCALLWGILPPVRPSLPRVRVPSLRNTVIIGLHACGDLGSNTCRLFASSRARGLLLVSCCWHALTSAGFPLSSAVRRRGMCTDKISLLLATQPLDMWSAVNSEGHRSSARLLFFRSLLSSIWRRVKSLWETECEEGKLGTACEGIQRGGADQQCTFAPVPKLEPTFLRRVARMKDSLTMETFLQEVLREYINEESAKQTPYTWDKHVCAACRREQQRHFKAALSNGIVNKLCGIMEKKHFAPFLGLTVLRMWMCHLVESILLLDRALYLHETLASQSQQNCNDVSSCVSLVPLFDGTISPRMYGVMARRI